MKFRKEEKEKTLTKIGRVKAPLSPGRLVGESSEFRIAQALFIIYYVVLPCLAPLRLDNVTEGNNAMPYKAYWATFIVNILWLNQVRMNRAFFMCRSISTSILKNKKMYGNNNLMPSFFSASRITTKRKASTKTSDSEGEILSSSTTLSDNNEDAVLQYEKKNTNVIAYRSTHITLKNTNNDDEINVPVSMWYPVHLDKKDLTNNDNGGTIIKYKYTISISKVAKLIAKWNLPKFLKRDFELDPMLTREENDRYQYTTTSEEEEEEEKSYIVDGADHLDIPPNIPIVLLAHGYLGSRWDLCHIAEEISQYGILCLSPEYPESLAASYEQTFTSTITATTTTRLDRFTITSKLLQVIQKEWKLQPTGYGIVGHSLGCGTVMSTGDETWVRICIAGPPATPTSFVPYSTSTIGSTSPILCIASPNDGAISWSRRIEPFLIQQDYHFVDDSSVFNTKNDLPYRSVYVFSDSPSSPNHISFLAENVNDAMISFLSFLLPIAKALNLPVLDFDKYRDSRDSRATAAKVVPLIRKFLLQHIVKR